MGRSDKLRTKLSRKKLPELRKECKELEIEDCIKRISTLRKPQLIDLIVEKKMKAKPSPSRHKPAPGRRKPSPSRRKPAPVRRKPSPSRRKPAPVRRKPSPARRKPSPVDKSDISKKTVKQLRKIMDAEDIPFTSEGSGKGGAYIKKDLVKAIVDFRAQSSPITEIEIPSEFKCYPGGKAKCRKDSKKPVCLTESGRCYVPFTRSTALQKKQKSMGYVYDEDTRLVGPVDEIEAYRSYLGRKEGPLRRSRESRSGSPLPSKPPLPPKPTRRRGTRKPLKPLLPPKPTRPQIPRKVKKCYDKEDWLECDSDEVCWSDGTCRPSSKREGQWVLKIDDRGYDIVGDEDHVRRLQKELGGDVIAPESVMEEVEEKLEKPKKEKEKVRRPRARPTSVSEAKKAEIRKTFEECLEKLS